MSLETAAIFLLIVIAVFPVVRTRGRRTPGVSALIVVALAGSATTALFVLDRQREHPISESEVEGRPIQVREKGYVSSDACQTCHPDEYGSWHDSYHRSMTQVASPESVMGRFDGQPVRALGRRVVPLEHDGDYYMDMPALSPLREGEERPAPGRILRRVVMTTGSHHMQAYWYESGDDRRVALAPIVWLREQQRWVPEPATFLKPPHQGLKRDGTRWNEVCQRCHATAPQPRMPDRGESGPIDTRVGELGIACEACHGPGQEHVDSHQNPLRRYAMRFSDAPDETIVNPARLSSVASGQVCGQCHSITVGWTEEEDDQARRTGYRYQPGDDLDATRWVIDGRDLESDLSRQIREWDPDFYKDRYWSDGEVRVSGREYHGLIASPCYAHDGPDEQRLTCLTCHTMHPAGSEPRTREDWADDQLRLAAIGNDTCLGCHPQFQDAISEHTQHDEGSPGSACMNCHMPYTTYGLMKAIRSHEISSPDVASTVTSGRPNACNACHLDRGLGWTADRLEEGYDIPRPPLADELERTPAGLLWLGTGDAGQRALAAWYMGWPAAQKASDTQWMAPFLATLLDDPYDTVRFIAGRSLATLPGIPMDAYNYMAPQRDRKRWVQEVRGAWAAAQGEPIRRNPVLRASAPDFDPKAWRALVERRDDGRVNLEE